MPQKTRQQVLKEKLESFQTELAITADPSRKFEMIQRIREIEEQIAQHASHHEPLSAHCSLIPSEIAGSKVNSYQVGEFIGAGGSGLVFRASHKDLGDQLAIKIFYPLAKEYSHFEGLFERGFSALSRLKHPNIVATKDSGRVNLSGLDVPYLVMDFIVGQTLERWSGTLGNEPAALALRLQVAKKLARAILAAHETNYLDQTGFEVHGVLHGDLKPANIMITPGNLPIVLDFLLVDVQRLLDPRVIHMQQRNNQAPLTNAYGTQGFMAPEQAETGTVTAASDIYGLGLTLCHLFVQKSMSPEIGIAQNEQLPKFLTTLLADMTSQQSRGRPESMREADALTNPHMAKKTTLDVLREKLEAFQTELAITADPNLKFELNQRIREIQEQIAKQEIGPSGAENRAHDTVLQRHVAHWKELLGSPSLATDDRFLCSPLAGLQRRLRDLRLDRYVWPGLVWEDPSRTDKHGKPLRTQLLGQDREPARTVLDTLLGGTNVVLYDVAGMGKTAFTLKLIELLFDSPPDLPNLREGPPLVLRLEGEWLRDANGKPRTIAATLEDAIARSLRYQDETVDESLIASAVRIALKHSRVVILVDAFDQMTEEDRQHVAGLLKGDAQEQIDRDDAALCAWLITGRPYALRKYQTELEALGAKRLRLIGLSREQQDRYFQDYETHPFFQQRQTKPLDWVCVARDEIDNDLAIPFHLREIRRLIEVDLAHPDGVRRISSTGELHCMIARALLQRAVQPYALKAVPPQARRPDDHRERLELLLRVCGLLAFQMMLEEKYNASVDNHEDVNAVRSFLERARNRFLIGERTSDSESASSANESWRWAEWMLEKIEFSHRGDIDSFNAQCRSFRDRKTMEWYAALYLMNYATTDDLRQKIAGVGDRCAADFAFDREWLSNCWKQAINMPRDLVQARVAIQSLGVLFQRPDRNRAEQTRPCELMWLAWERWLEPANRSRDASPSAMSRPLTSAADLIAQFRDEFQSLYAANNELALTLQFVAQRDRPDTKLGNKTQDGQYRLIPPNATSTTFQGERPSPVTISAFWLRKFVVTNAEYGLFDPHFSSGKDFDQPDRPVVGLDWYGAAMFCRWLGAAYCLPTEAQWEAACRANETPAQEAEFWFGEERQLANHAWYEENAEGRTHGFAESVQAGGRDNPWGLYMHGNVWEWCQDWYGAYAQAVGQNNPQGPEVGSSRVHRGGGWGFSVRTCRSANRGSGSPSHRISDLGFRVALSLSGQESSPGSAKPPVE